MIKPTKKQRVARIIEGMNSADGWIPATQPAKHTEAMEETLESYTALKKRAETRIEVLEAALRKVEILAESSELCGDKIPAVTARTLLPICRAALAAPSGDVRHD